MINTNVIQPSFFRLWEGKGELTIWGRCFSAVPEWFSTNIIEPIKSFFTGLGRLAIWGFAMSALLFSSWHYNDFLGL